MYRLPSSDRSALVGGCTETTSGVKIAGQTVRPAWHWAAADINVGPRSRPRKLARCAIGQAQPERKRCIRFYNVSRKMYGVGEPNISMSLCCFLRGVPLEGGPVHGQSAGCHLKSDSSAPRLDPRTRLHSRVIVVSSVIAARAQKQWMSAVGVSAPE